jgi:hypothetical protein
LIATHDRITTASELDLAELAANKSAVFFRRRILLTDLSSSHDAIPPFQALSPVNMRFKPASTKSLTAIYTMVDLLSTTMMHLAE